MARIVWLTDIHLNFVESDVRQALYESLLRENPNSILVSGDIAEAPSLASFLVELDEVLQLPIYFVLGNHDFYYGSVAAVRRSMIELTRQRERLTYLSASDVIPLAAGVGLVGHDGWADGRIGDYETSMIVMNDYRLIEDLASLGKEARWTRLMAFADEAAEHLSKVLPNALDTFPHVFVLTHVPPWRSACWYNGSISDDEWAPHFTSQAVGDAILRVAERYPDRKVTVLCGHTHSPGEARVAANVEVSTGGAVYAQPAICRVLELPGEA